MDRREIIRTGAVAGGLVWAAPALRSVRPSQAAGSTPPSTATSTTLVVEPSTSTTVPDDCNATCSFTLHTTEGDLTCTVEDPEDCGCLCACAGADVPCSRTNPCDAEIVCAPVGGGDPAPLFECVGHSPR